jgi:hypothetical protein
MTQILNHAEIVAKAGGPAAMDRLCGTKAGTAKQWKRQNSIPAPYWAAIAREGVATLEVLAEAAEAKAAVSHRDGRQGVAA